MAKATAVTLQVGEREVRVSSPERVVYEATTRTPEVTKLQICEYFAGIGEAFMHANGNRPVALERWPGGWREGMTLSVGPMGQQQGDGFYSKRLPKGAPEWIETVRATTPNRRPIDELLISEPAAAVWAAHMGTLTFHPWAVRADDVEHPDELRIDFDPQPAATFADVKRIAALARDLFAELGIRAFVKTSGNRGVHVYVRIRPQWTFEEVRHAAIGFGRELERRDSGLPRLVARGAAGHLGFPRLQPEPPGSHGGLGLESASQTGRSGEYADELGPAGQLADPAEFHVFSVPEFLADGDAWAEIDEVAHSLEPLLALWGELPGGELNFPPDHPKMPGEPPRVQPSKKVAEHWDADGNRLPD